MRRSLLLLLSVGIPALLVAAETRAGEMPYSPLTGESGDGFGGTAASVGDHNGDGVPDFAVGATGAVEVRVFDGATGERLFAIPGDGTNFGSLVRAGDFDGDGVMDILVSAWGSNRVGSPPGFVSVFSGESREEIARVHGATSSGSFGWTAEVIGDVNGDGHADLIVGEPGVTGASPGTVWLFSGEDQQPIPGREVKGGENAENLGTDFAVLGDVNGDQVDDFAIGSRWRDPKGKGRMFVGQVVVYSGASSKPLYTVDGKDQYWQLGRAVAAVGDVDGDGAGDLAVGVPGVKQVVVVSGGKRGKPIRVLSAPGDEGGFGQFLAPVEDSDGDGVGDLIVGSQDKIQVFSLGRGAKLFEYEGEQYSGVGEVFASAGDLNGDGVPEILLGGVGSETVRVLTFEPPVFVDPDQKLKAGATLGRAESIAGSKAKAQLSLSVKKSKVTLTLSCSKLPADGEYAAFLEIGTGTGVFKEIARLNVTGGKGKLALTGDGVFPPELGGIAGLGDLENRRLELRDAGGNPVLSGHMPVLDLPKSTKSSLAFLPVEGGPGGSGQLKISHKASTGAMKFDLKLKGVPKGERASLWVETSPGTGEYEEAAGIEDGRLVRDTGKGQLLPWGIPLVLDFERFRMFVSWRDQVAMVYAPPDTGPKPDFRVREIRLSEAYGRLLVQVDVRNRGAADAGRVDLTARVEYLSGSTSPTTTSMRTSMTFPAGAQESLDFPVASVEGPLDLVRVRVEVDPKSHTATVGEYFEEREYNNVRCTIFMHDPQLLTSFDTICTSTSDCLVAERPNAPDFEVTGVRIESHTPGSVQESLVFYVTVQNSGSGNVTPAELSLVGTVSFPSSGADPEPFGQDATDQMYIGSEWEMGPFRLDLPAGTLGEVFRVRAEVDPPGGGNPLGDYEEEREGNNVRCTVFTLVEGEYEQTATFECR